MLGNSPKFFISCPTVVMLGMDATDGFMPFYMFDTFIQDQSSALLIIVVRPLNPLSGKKT